MTLDAISRVEQNWVDPAKETYVYCQSGGRASQTAVVLGEPGFRNVRVLENHYGERVELQPVKMVN